MKLFAFIFLCVHIGWCQTLDPKHYPAPENWEQIFVKNSDTVLTCMRYYFCSDDTIYFREHPSMKVVKYALADVSTPVFSIGRDYQFQKKGARISTRMFYSQKLDRYYDYYLHAPLLVLNTRRTEVPKEIELAQEIDTRYSWNTPKVSDPNANFGEMPQKILYHNSGCTYYLDDFYFMSNGELFFKLSGKPGVYSLPLSMIKGSEGIYELGRDLDLAHRLQYRKNTRRMLGFSIIFYPTYLVTLPIGIFRAVRHGHYREAKPLKCGDA